MFSSIEFNSQFFTLLIAFLAVLIPASWGFIQREDKKKELKQKGIELFLALEAARKDDKVKDDFGYLVSKADCLHTISGYKAELGFYDTLGKFKDPVSALEKYRKYHLIIKDFDTYPRVKGKKRIVLIFMAIIIASFLLLPLMAFQTINSYNLLFKKNVAEKPQHLDKKDVTIVSKSEWVLDGKTLTLTAKGKPSLEISPYKPIIENKEELQSNDSKEKESEGNNVQKLFYSLLSTTINYIYTLFLIMILPLSFFMQIFLFILIFGSSIRALIYIGESKKNIEEALAVVDSYVIVDCSEQDIKPSISLKLYFLIKDILAAFLPRFFRH